MQIVDIIKQFNLAALITPIDFIAIPFLLGLIPILLLTYKKEIKVVYVTQNQANLKYFVIGLIAIFLSVVLLTFPPLSFNKDKTPSNIFIYEGSRFKNCNKVNIFLTSP